MSRAIFAINQVNLPQEGLKTLYYSLVHPHLAYMYEYYISLWSYVRAVVHNTDSIKILC